MPCSILCRTHSLRNEAAPHTHPSPYSPAVDCSRARTLRRIVEIGRTLVRPLVYPPL